MNYFYIFILSILSSALYANELLPIEPSLEPITDQVVQQSKMSAMTDEELSEVQGQALYSLGRQEQGGLSFYTLSMEAKIALNANIKSLQLGCGGVNGADKCDIDISSVSFGCIANSSGTCINLPKTDTRQPDGKVQETASGVQPTQSQMKDFNLTNPFFQFAIKNPDSASTREIVGIRIGATQAEGPLSFGNLTTFSGYLTGKANLDMQEMGKGRNPNDVAVTCGPDSSPCPGTQSGNGYNTFGYTGDRTLGLANDSACVLIFICEQFKNLTVSFDGAQREGLPVVVNGNRVTQALVSNLQLGAAVDGIVNSLDFVKSNGIPATLIDIIKPLIAGQVKTKIKNQLANGLGTSVAALDNNTYKLPFNLSNVHSIDVNSNSFGIALSKQNIQYPGYDVAVNTGWSMYLKDAFTLSISEPTTRLVGNIAKGSGADGNIALLPTSYRNCYGSLKFC